MAGTFTAIDLSQLPAPGVVETVSFEAILSEIVSDFATRYPEFTAYLESEPAIKLLEVAAYRETIVRQRVNDAAKAVMLSSAVGADLDQIGANYFVPRLLLQAADNTVTPPIPAVYESDADYRTRIQLSPEGYTTAGSRGSYEFHGLSADPKVRDVQAISPAPGNVTVYVLSREGTGLASNLLLDAVAAALNAERVRPLTDQVSVLSASIKTYSVNAELTLYDGPDSDVVRAAAISAAEEYAEGVRRIGYDVTVSGLYQALHQPGVQSVRLISPAASVVCGDGESAYMANLAISVAGQTDA